MARRVPSLALTACIALVALLLAASLSGAGR